MATSRQAPPAFETVRHERTRQLTVDVRESAAALVEKRTPAFRGR